MFNIRSYPAAAVQTEVSALSTRAAFYSLDVISATVGTVRFHTFFDLRAATILSAFALSHFLPYFLLRRRTNSCAALFFFFMS